MNINLVKNGDFKDNFNYWKEQTNLCVEQEDGTYYAHAKNTTSQIVPILQTLEEGNKFARGQQYQLTLKARASKSANMSATLNVIGTDQHEVNVASSPESQVLSDEWHQYTFTFDINNTVSLNIDQTDLIIYGFEDVTNIFLEKK